jgi:hypothetical protein
MMEHAQMNTPLAERYAAVRLRLGTAVRRAGRAPADVTLVAVSKYHPAEAVAAVAALGQRDFGENYVQEALQKQEALAGEDILWHCIGHVQSRKAKDVAGRFALIHTVDSEKLAHNLHKALWRPEDDTCPIVQDVLLQVNIGEEVQKSGIDAAETARLAETVLQLPTLRLCGLMCLPPFFDDGEAARPFFAALRKLRDDLERSLGVPLPHLSMGMSGDFEQAVEEGATIVRVGTDIFGPRPPRP